MSRSLLGFLLFCLLLLLASAGVVWYMGPTLAGILVDGERRENAYYLLQLLPAAAAEAGEGTRSYRQRFATLAAEDEGRLLWQGGRVDVVEGSVLLDVAAVQVVQFTTGADLVQMFTGTGYRSLETGFGGRVRHLGTSAGPQPLADDAATVVVLYHWEPGTGGAAPLGVAGESGWLKLLTRHNGEVRWKADVSPIRSSAPWSRLLVVQFPHAMAARAWLEDPITVTERAIADKRVDDLVVMLIQPGAFAAR